MDRLEQRVFVALNGYRIAQIELEKTRGMGYAQLACYEWTERARMALRHAVIMQEANNAK